MICTHDVFNVRLCIAERFAMKKTKIIPITPNAGGIIENIIGRNNIIEKLWKILYVKGVVLNAHRRFGKSLVLKKMVSQERTGFLCIYIDVEKINNADEFVLNVFRKLKEKKLIDESNIKKVENIFNKVVKKVPEFKGIKFDHKEEWKNRLEYLFILLSQQNKDKHCVVMLDEFSIMLDKMNTLEAVDMLGMLRGLPAEEKISNNLRFIYCGSIGMGTVVDKLKKSGYNIGEPLNAMYIEKLEPFEQEEADCLIKCLCKGCKLKLSDALITKVRTESDRIPFIIHRVFEEIQYENKIDDARITKAFDEIINDQNDKTSLKHLFSRLEIYYKDQKGMFYHILNFLSKMDGMATENSIINHVNSQMEGLDEFTIQEAIDQLWRDDYLERKSQDDQRYFSFVYGILKKWWRVNRAR